MPVRPNACHIGASCESFFLLQFFASTLVCTYTYKRIYTHEFVYDRFTNEKRIVKVKLLRWCRVKMKEKKKKKLEKKKRKRIDACTVYFHHFWILCTLTLLIYGIFVDVYRTTKREIGGQPFNDTIRSLFFFSQWLRCSFVARPCYVCIIIGRNVAHEKYLFNIFFLLILGECKCIFAELSGTNNNYIRKEGGKTRRSVRKKAHSFLECIA